MVARNRSLHMIILKVQRSYLDPIFHYFLRVVVELHKLSIGSESAIYQNILQDLLAQNLQLANSKCKLLQQSFDHPLRFLPLRLPLL